MSDRSPVLSAQLPDEYFQSTPTPFLHLPKIHAEYNRAAESTPSSEASQSQTASVQGKARGDFAAAHEGPREKIAEPKKDYVLTPLGEVEQLVHTQQDKEAIARNNAKDAQMEAWRNVEIGTTRTFNARSLAPDHLRPVAVPDVFRSGQGRHQRESQENQRDR